jgi:predicted Zn-dependent protease
MRICIYALLTVLLLHAAHASGQYVTISIPKQDSATVPKDTLTIPPVDIAVLYKENPDKYYESYISHLISEKKFKTAEKVIEEKKKNDNRFIDPTIFIDLGYIYELQGKNAKANEEYEKSYYFIDGDDALTKHITKKFIALKKYDNAIAAYGIADSLMNNPAFYSDAIAQLYGKKGDYATAVAVLIHAAPLTKQSVDHAKSVLLQILGNDAEKIKAAQKSLLRAIDESPDNVYLADMLAWCYLQRNDWEGALLQLEAIDERNNETGKRLMEFGHSATAQQQYDIAERAFSDVLKKGPTLPFYIAAEGQLISVSLEKLKNNNKYKDADVDTLMARYDDYLKMNPAQYCTNMAADYADVAARYGHDADKAIEILNTAIHRPDIKRETAGSFKLLIGDYYVLLGKIWDASLTYSQVDKEFKQDALGEDARFRNAKLAYYRGDFKWAQRQLLLLKSATSELIANDAIYLSVLITENVEDTDNHPLMRFAEADLLLFQNRDKEALQLLDSMKTAYPKHPLADDILMLEAKIAVKHHEYDTAIQYFKKIHEAYGTDVLGDDALLQLAHLYENQLMDPEKARHYYEQLILEYPGSTYVQQARQKLHDFTHGQP